MVKHTSGPWHQDKYGNVLDARGEKIVTTGLALVSGIWPNNEPEANARLIAAAPELLAALERIYELYPSEMESSQIARAAIAKARGE